MPIGFNRVHFVGVVGEVNLGRTPHQDETVVFSVGHRDRHGNRIWRDFVAYGGLNGLLRQMPLSPGTRVTVLGMLVGEAGSPIRVSEMVFDKRAPDRSGGKDD